MKLQSRNFPESRILTQELGKRSFVDGRATNNEIHNRSWSIMDYKNLDLKIDQFVSYVNENKINLLPPFQRGHVWKPKMRRKLIENIICGRPIPAIFLYREASGDKYSYNILDGKQRLESLMLFIGNERDSLQIKDVSSFFYDTKLKDQINFLVEIGGNSTNLKTLEDDLFRDFREYVIPTIEITLNEDSPTGLDEMIDLFVDINSYGVQVKRFDIVKAISKDPLLESTFDMIAEKQTRRKDTFYRSKRNEFTWTLKQLQVITSIQNANAKVDRMWELLVEIVLFLRTNQHRTPVDILKNFIKAKNEPQKKQLKVSRSEIRTLRQIFRFLRKAFRTRKLNNSRLITNQIHFYTMITSIIAGKLLEKFTAIQLTKKFSTFSILIGEDGVIPANLRKSIKEYRDLSEKHTTHPGRRTDRQNLFLKVINIL